MATRIQGVDRLKRKLRALPNAAREDIAKAMEQSANEIVALMKSLVPVDSGALRASIDWSWGDGPAGSIALGSVRGSGRGAGNLVITIYAGNAETYVAGERVYFQIARLIEFGTKNMPASPYFFPAYRALRRRVRGRTTRAINKSAKRIAAGG